MPRLTIAIGADNGGYEQKQEIARHLKAEGHRVLDVGTCSTEPADYPVYGIRVAESVGHGPADLGVLLCRSGNGMAMVANKVRGVRAAIATNIRLAELARLHNDANVLVLGSDFMADDVTDVLDTFIKTQAEDGRHARRVDIIKNYDATVSSGLPTHQLVAEGQSPWLDDISDMIIASGELKELIEERGVRGLTSNPSIFEKAINSGEGRYRAQLTELKKAGKSATEAYEQLTTEDIAAAADLLRPVYDRTGGDDGFVSLEVLPSLAYDEEATVSEAKRLFKTLDRPNIMIKVPGTAEGIRAFRRLTAEGVNVNVTLIFSRRSYNEIARAYIAGLGDAVAGVDITAVRSVASVFVSRVDTLVDKKLEAIEESESDEAKLKLVGEVMHRAAIANTRLIYDDFGKIFHGDEFADLASRGAAVQRPLWGSTSTKCPELSDVLYVEELIGPETVNTIPRATLEAFLDHGRVRGNTLAENVAGAAETIEKLRSLGIGIEEVCDELQKAGVKAFADSFDQLFASIEKALA